MLNILTCNIVNHQLMNDWLITAPIVLFLVCFSLLLPPNTPELDQISGGLQ